MVKQHHCFDRRLGKMEPKDIAITIVIVLKYNHSLA